MMRAFSLVELSIVLVILGLLTGGILAGQSLIRAAELRAVTTEYNRWVTAVGTFRDKYMAIPGDMNNAVAFWNRQVNQSWCLPTTGATVTTPGTCNGNGDGKPTSAGAASQSGEVFQFWRQLALAGVIEGSYTGLAGASGTSHMVFSDNVPASKLNNAGWGTGSWGVVATGDASVYAMDYGNVFIIGGQSNASPNVAILRPEEAWNIDTKLDDGKPASGTIIARYWNNACAAADDGTHASNDLAASYKVSDSSLQCTLFFRNVY